MNYNRKKKIYENKFIFGEACYVTPGLRPRSILKWEFKAFKENVNTHQHLAARRIIKGNQSII
jgi:hypothetical protein